jgi:DNA-binding transcriptional MerR regulator
MTASLSLSGSAPDALGTLRSYRPLAPWGLRDLTALSAAILDASGVVPVNASARARPSERTIRFYVARGLVSPPEGRGTAAVYAYRHLLQVLAIKLRQMEGATLETIIKEFEGQTGDVTERRVASTLGPGLPAPERLPLAQLPNLPRGRVGRAVQALAQAQSGRTPAGRPSLCFRIPVSEGVELLLDERHPAARSAGEAARLADRVRGALGEPPLDEALPTPAAAEEPPTG